MSYKRVQVEGGIQTGNDLVLKSREAGEVAPLFRALLFVSFLFFVFVFVSFGFSRQGFLCSCGACPITHSVY